MDPSPPSDCPESRDIPLLPPTIIVVHPREKRRKCTVRHLAETTGYVFWKFPKRGPEPVTGYVRLALDGPLLSPADAAGGLLLLDGTWHLARRMEPFFRDVPPRSLGPWQTAYPRVSKVFDDPSAGLATIEALYAARVQLGLPVAGLLSHYHWQEEFESLNRDLISSYSPASQQIHLSTSSSVR
jgi:pre-rRNA-processing protein TSR3